MSDEQSLAPQDPFNRTNETAIINLITPGLQASIFKAHEARPELFGMDEKALWKKLRLENHQPCPTDNRLRYKFWAEYDLAQHESRAMRSNAIIAGVCDTPYFYQNFMMKPHKVAWLMAQPANYEALTEEALAAGLDKLRDVLDENPVSDGGVVNVKLAEIQFKIVQFLDTRVKGAVVQKTLNVNASLPKKSPGVDKEASNRELERRLESIEKLRRKAFNVDDATVVTIEPEKSS